MSQTKVANRLAETVLFAQAAARVKQGENATTVAANIGSRFKLKSNAVTTDPIQVFANRLSVFLNRGENTDGFTLESRPRVQKVCKSIFSDILNRAKSSGPKDRSAEIAQNQAEIDSLMELLA